MLLDLIFGSSFKVKPWFTGFVELSFRWIQICIGSPMRRFSFDFLTYVRTYCALGYTFSSMSIPTCDLDGFKWAMINF